MSVDVAPGVNEALKNFVLPETLGFGAVNAPGELHTPELDTAILPGVTRDSLIKLARRLGFTVHERQMDVDELLAQIGSGGCSEIFACGTAAIVMPISALADTDNRVFKPRETNVIASRLRDSLLAIQERRAPDPFGWIRVLS
jgi:branched-chain amino acid aminotransferase